MARRLHVIDSGAAARRARRLFVIDAGGVSRAIKRLFVIDAGGTARQVFQSAYLEASLTVGTDGVSFFGYNPAFYGALAPDTYTDGAAASRQIKLCHWNGASVILWLNGGGVPDSDATFSALELDGTTLARSSATYNGAASGGTMSQWTWASGFMHGGSPIVLRMQS